MNQKRNNSRVQDAGQVHGKESTLLPMLFGGLMLVIIGGSVVMTIL